jgi:hypothetical protein
MKNRTRKRLIALTSLVLLFSLVGTSLAATFNPNYIISDDEIFDSESMSLSEIEDFLNARDGYISKHNFLNSAGQTKTAAQIIHDAAANNYDCEGVSLGLNPTQAEKERKCKKIAINPKFLIVLLQKEQSLVTSKNPRQTQLDWATGYGCPDGQACNTRWKGFGKQVNSASLQFYDYMQNPTHYPYVAGRTYTVTNTGRPSSRITPINQATASLYNYTPHVYNGNFNFYNLWLRYFSHSYPNGTLLQAKGEPGIWLIQNGKKRPFLSKGALTSRFDLNKVVMVNPSDLEAYTKGDPIKFPQYSLVRSPRGTIFLLVDDKRRGFADSEAFRKIGYNPEEIIDASWADLMSYEEGKTITANSEYLTGALLQDKTSGGVYWVTEGTKAPLWDSVLLKTKYKGKSITPVDSEKLASYETVEPAIFGDGELITSPISPAVYVIEGKKRMPITSGKLFEDLGYKWDNIITVPTKILELYVEGEAITDIVTEEEPLEELPVEVEEPEYAPGERVPPFGMKELL